jgi:hypothetical protein
MKKMLLKSSSKGIRIVSIFITLFLLMGPYASAAQVECTFDTGETYNSSTGAWTGSILWEKVYMLFEDGLTLNLEDSTMKKLDANRIFEAGATQRGIVYLLGDEGGITTRMTSLKDEVLTVYGGYCSVGFG